MHRPRAADVVRILEGGTAAAAAPRRACRRRPGRAGQAAGAADRGASAVAARRRSDRRGQRPRRRGPAPADEAPRSPSRPPWPWSWPPRWSRGSTASAAASGRPRSSTSCSVVIGVAWLLMSGWIVLARLSHPGLGWPDSDALVHDRPDPRRPMTSFTRVAAAAALLLSAPLSAQAPAARAARGAAALPPAAAGARAGGGDAGVGGAAPDEGASGAHGRVRRGHVDPVDARVRRGSGLLVDDLPDDVRRAPPLDLRVHAPTRRLRRAPGAGRERPGRPLPDLPLAPSHADRARRPSSGATSSGVCCTRSSRTAIPGTSS